MGRDHDGNAAFHYRQELLEASGIRLIVNSFIYDDREQDSCHNGRLAI